MICPLRLLANCSLPMEESIEEGCIKEKCAWWEPKIDGCLIKDIAHSLRNINVNLRDIASKTPVGG